MGGGGHQGVRRSNLNCMKCQFKAMFDFFTLNYRITIYIFVFHFSFEAWVDTGLFPSNLIQLREVIERRQD